MSQRIRERNHERNRSVGQDEPSNKKRRKHEKAPLLDISDEADERIPLVDSPTHSRSHALIFNGINEEIAVPKKHSDKRPRNNSDAVFNAYERQSISRPSMLDLSDPLDSITIKDEMPPVQPPPVVLVNFNKFRIVSTPSEAPPLKVVNGMEKVGSQNSLHLALLKKREEEKKKKMQQIVEVEKDSNLTPAPQLLLTLESEAPDVERKKKRRRPQESNEKKEEGKAREKRKGRRLAQRSKSDQCIAEQMNQMKQAPVVGSQLQEEQNKNSPNSEEKESKKKGKLKQRRRKTPTKQKRSRSQSKIEENQENLNKSHPLVQPEEDASKLDQKEKDSTKQIINEHSIKEDSIIQARKKSSSYKAKDSRSTIPIKKKINESDSSSFEFEKKPKQSGGEVKQRLTFKERISKQIPAALEEEQNEVRPKSERISPKKLAVLKQSPENIKSDENEQEDKLEKVPSEESIPSSPKDESNDSLVFIGILPSSPATPHKESPSLPPPPLDVSQDPQEPLLTQYPEPEATQVGFGFGTRPRLNMPMAINPSSQMRPVPGWLSFQIPSIPDPDDADIELEASSKFDFIGMLRQTKNL